MAHDNKIQKKPKDVLSNTMQSIDGKTRYELKGKFKDGKHILVVGNGKIDNVIYRNAKHGTKLSVGKTSLNKGTGVYKKPSLIARTVGKVAEIGGKILSAGKKIVNVAKTAGMAFLKASHFVGKKVV